MFFKKKEKVDINSNLIEICALLIHAAKIDEHFSEKEEKIIKQTMLKIGVKKDHLDKLFILGNNGKIIDLDNIPINVPRVTGTSDIKKVFQTLKMIDKSNFNTENIKNIEFFQSERVDIEFINKKKIRFPINYTVDNFNFALKLLDDDRYSKSKILDLRIPNKVITYD